MVQPRNAHPDHDPTAPANIPSSTIPTYNGKPISGPTSKLVGKGDTPQILHGIDLDNDIPLTGWRSHILPIQLIVLNLAILFIGFTGTAIYYGSIWYYQTFIHPVLRILSFILRYPFVRPSVDWSENKVGTGTATDPYRVVIIGSGYSGLGLAMQLQKSKMLNYIVLERGASVGGAWRDNSFPGCACDVPSQLYSFSFQPWPLWSRFWPLAAEIKKYIEWCAETWQVHPHHIQYHTNVTGATWQEHTQTWAVTTSTGAVIHGNILVNGQGFLSDARIPDVSGLSTYQGKIFHSTQWDHTYDFHNKKVAVIGTGATAIQVVPELQKQVQQLYHFQRSAWWIRPRLGGHNFTISEKWQKRYVRYPFLQTLTRLAIYWSGEGLYPVFTKYRIFNKLLAKESIRFIYETTSDPVLRRKLIPTFEFGCRRMLLSSEFYPSLTNKNIDIIQSGLQSVTQHGVVDKDGNEYDVDAIILCTGFHTQKQETKKKQQILLDIVGRNGVKLQDVWKDSMTAYKGTTIPGFPNYFVILGPNTNVAAISVTYMGECQQTYIMDALHEMKRLQFSSVEAVPELTRSWNERIQGGIKSMVWQTGGCYSWYQDSKTGFNTIMWPYFNFLYMWYTQTFDVNNYSVTKKKTVA